MKTKVFKIKETCVFCTINFFMTKYLVMTKCLVTYLKQETDVMAVKEEQVAKQEQSDDNDDGGGDGEDEDDDEEDAECQNDDEDADNSDSESCKEEEPETPPRKLRSSRRSAKSSRTASKKSHPRQRNAKQQNNVDKGKHRRIVDKKIEALTVLDRRAAPSYHLAIMVIISFVWRGQRVTAVWAGSVIAVSFIEGI